MDSGGEGPKVEASSASKEKRVIRTRAETWVGRNENAKGEEKWEIVAEEIRAINVRETEKRDRKRKGKRNELEEGK